MVIQPPGTAIARVHTAGRLLREARGIVILHLPGVLATEVRGAVALTEVHEAARLPGVPDTEVREAALLPEVPAVTEVLLHRRVHPACVPLEAVAAGEITRIP